MRIRRFPRFSFFFCLLLLFTLGFASCKLDDPNDLNGVGSLRIERDTIWKSDNPILLEGTLHIEGATLTIEAGTTIRMGERAKIMVGEQKKAGLRILGTANQPVRITAQSKESSWRGIHFLKNNGNSRIHFLELQRAGQGDTYALSFQNLNFLVTDSQLLDCEGNAINIQQCAATTEPYLRNIYIQAAHGFAIYGHASLLSALGGGLKLTSPNGIYLTGGSLSLKRCTFYNYNCPYVVKSEIAINAEEVTIPPNTRFEFERDGALNFGQFTTTRIHADNVTFTSRSTTKNPGTWQSVIVNTYVLGAQSYFRKCTFEAGGGGEVEGALVVYDVKDLEVSNSHFAHNRGYGIVLYGAQLKNEKGNTFSSNTRGDIRKN